ncbi:MAG: PD40 domain-containing protein [Proteobacteria bacterium]|nr:PD40 domain-containing protein [Pseudomonadota bacterium]
MGHAFRLAVVVLGVFTSFDVSASAHEVRLLRRPTVSRTEVAFAYAGDLWIVGRTGGRARRLTSTPSIETDPHFSPDGSMIAFTAQVNGNSDVYVIPSKGGTPRRLTYHPELDLVRGWTRDGKRVIFASSRGTLPTPIASSYARLWMVDVGGGMPQLLPMPRAYTGTYSPDGQQFAYEEFSTEFELKEGEWQSAQWRHYRGGRTHPITVMNLSDHTEKKLPWRDSNDRDPMWIGDTLYFVSDRNFTANLFAYHTVSGQVQQLTHHDDFDVMNASAGPDSIVYEQGGYLHLLELPSGRSRQLHIQIEGDFPWMHPQTRSVVDRISSAAVAPDGSHVAFEARGDIFLQAVPHGSAINFTHSPGAHERNPAWSADGSQLAWLSDASGEYQLLVADVARRGTPRVLNLPVRGYFTTPVWSPDAKHLLLRDNHLTLWLIELGSGHATRVDADLYDDPYRRIDAVWSPDSCWIAYSRNLSNRLRALFLYSVQEHTTHQITDSGVDVISPAFDHDGKNVYFLVSTDYAKNIDWPSMTAIDRPVTRTAYALSLYPDDKSGTIPVDALHNRIAPLEIPPGDYAQLIAGPPGVVFLTEYEKRGMQRVLSPSTMTVQRYRVHEHQITPFLQNIDAYALSPDGGRVLYRRQSNHRWALALAERSTDDADTQIDTEDLHMQVEPRAEWANIFREAWRIQRDFFYQPTMHGANWNAMYQKYVAWLPFVKHRADLGYLLAMVGGELSVSHSALKGTGDLPDAQVVKVGMLGADYSVENGHYRIKRIYRGDPWNPAGQAPLAVTDLDVREGDYLLAVNGKPVSTAAEVYAAFEGTAGKPTQLRVGSTPQAEGSRVVTVTPVENDEPLRTFEDWIDKNRKRVAELSGGRIGYVWLPNTGPHGYWAFNREFYAQLDKAGVIVDERYNQGGFMPDYLVDALTRAQFGYLAMRDGATSPSPIDAIYGPKVMLINESSGSGGDALAYQFKLVKGGPLIGTRTWGGLVGVEEPPVPETIDGGGMSAPNYSVYNSKGRWVIENEGIVPDIEVTNTAAEVIAGHDPQLERAVAEALHLLESHPVPHVPKPAPPDRVSPSQIQ